MTIGKPESRGEVLGRRIRGGAGVAVAIVALVVAYQASLPGVTLLAIYAALRAVISLFPTGWPRIFAGASVFMAMSAGAIWVVSETWGEVKVFDLARANGLSIPVFVVGLLATIAFIVGDVVEKAFKYVDKKRPSGRAARRIM